MHMTGFIHFGIDIDRLAQYIGLGANPTHTLPQDLLDKCLNFQLYLWVLMTLVVKIVVGHPQSLDNYPPYDFIDTQVLFYLQRVWLLCAAARYRAIAKTWS